MASHSSPSSAQAATSRNSIANGATSPTLPVEKHGKLHHPFPASIAPYPVNCEKAVIDADSLDVAFRLQLFEGNPSSIPAIRLDNPKTHPQRCLDVGCGSGDWLLAAAKVWPNTTFVGLDLMIGHQLPVQLLHGLGTSATSPVGATRDPGSSTPSSISHLRTTSVNGQNPTNNNIANESSTGVAELSVLESRIQWVQANFLKTLPFYDDEFDYVHISGISRGVPEDKWDGFLSEISRVLAPGGHLEMIEEDVIFPIIPSSSSSSSSCEPDQTPSDPAHAAHTAMPFDQPAHNASGSAISNAKRSFRTSTSSSFYCIGNESLGDTLFYGVYERRFINTCPTAILPSMLNMYFQNVLVTPPIDFPTPPPPAMAREIVRREKRNMIQREFGRAGLENSQGVGLHLAQSLNNIKAVPHQVARLKGTGRLQHLGAWNDGPSDRLVKRAKSSPALRVSPTSPSGSQSSRALSPDWFSSNSSYRRSDSPVSSGVSFVATPTSVSTGDPMIQSPTRYIGGSSINDSTLSPDSITPTTPFIGVQGSKDEEEDAKLAIMGDGGCFTLESGAASIQEEQRPVSPRPPSSSRHMSVDGETLGVAESLNWTDDLDDLDILTCEGVEDAALKELHNFDHVAAQELGVFDGVAFEPEEAILEDIWDSRELLRDRVYVRPRATFAGQGLPVPSALLEMDDLSMGLHLTRCWTNVVACREAMWEELQRRAKLVGNPEGSEVVHRTTPLDEIQWVGTEKRLSDRDKFDLLFQRFEDDMRAWAAVGSEIPRKLSWIDPRYPHHGPVPFLNHNKNNASSSVMIESRRGSSSAASSISSPVHCYGWDDNRGPGKQGIVVPGVDTCRTLRVFIARKTEEGPSPGGNSMKISSILG
ncbi:hypothetical protein FRC18_002389 [Serendipita sp. 400]|nr:hypothetical protein FRC18_002389 [Serendipita sp. 400]